MPCFPFKSTCLQVAFPLMVAACSASFSIMFMASSNSRRTMDYMGWEVTKIMQQQKQEKVLSASVPKTPLNILILFPDDWRHDSLQDVQQSLPNGNTIFTPFLSELAKDGIRFTHNAVTTSICWISRATLFTGQYVSRHKAESLSCPTFAFPEYWKDLWVARLQKDAGYFVGHVGKWQYHNSRRFFQSEFKWTSLHEGYHWQPPGPHFANQQHLFSNYTERRGKKNEKLPAADLSKEDALYFLRHARPKDSPFALTIAFYPPKPVGESREPGGQWDPTQHYKKLYEKVTFHRPYNVTQAYEALPPNLFRMSENRFYQRWKTDEQFQESMRNYNALITNVDDASREIVQELKRQGLYESTLIIFTCDNGMMLGNHGLAGKWHPFEESIRVPLIIHDPRIPPEKRGTLEDRFTLNVDLAETILGAAGLKPSPHMQGRDIADLYLGRVSESHPWREDFYYEFPLADILTSSSLVTKKYKYVRYEKRNNNGAIEQVFDLEHDPYELNDLMNSTTTQTQVDVLTQLKQRYEELKAVSINNDGIDIAKCVKGENP
ncbi:arylsulfatase [Nitzschia inconspicua]|uniref:Arylsulfatase n=1 Tax=Nitzschia inconspicua TaxID=303405 RepID=A0A9K3M2B9_9STRA|nr:arylsulfatase [Nitzschia inconspicua]